MSRIGVFVATVIAGLACVGSALAQGVPPRLQGDYAIGSCAAPDVDVTIDAAGLHVFDPQSGDSIADVAALSVEDRGAQVVIDVVVDGDEAGTMTLVALGDGTVEVRYQPDGGAPEAPQRLELCVAADVPAQPPVATMSAVPDALHGEWVTGSCEAPQDRLVIEGVTLTAYDQGSPAPTAVVDVLSVETIPGGYLVAADFAGQQVGVELNVVNQDILELVFIDADGFRADPEELLRCAPVVDTPPVSPAVALPDAYLGRYAVGTDAVCGAGETEVIFEPSRLTVVDGGEEVMTIDVVNVVATEPDLVFAVVARGDPGEVTMRQIGASSYEVVFTETGGSSEAPEVFNYCAADAGPATDAALMTALPAEYLGRYVIGEGASCADGSTEVIFEATRLSVREDGEEVTSIEVTGVIMTAPELVFTVLALGDVGEVAMRSVGGGRYEVIFTETATGSSDSPEIFTACAEDAGPVIDTPVSAVIPDVYLGRYAFDGATCDSIAAGDYLLFEPTRLVVMDAGQEAFVIAVTGVTATAPNLVFTVDVPGEGAGEIAMTPSTANRYDVTMTEEGSSTPDTDEFIFCDAAPAVDGPAVDGPVVDGPVVGPAATEVPEAYLGRYAIGDDPARCSAEDEALFFEPTRLVMMDNGEEEMVIAVTAVIATEPNLVLAIVEDRMGEAELALVPRGDGVYDATITEPDGSVENETLVFCSAAAGPTVEGPVVEGPVVDVAPILAELPAAYLGRYVFDDDSGLGCEGGDNEVIFEATRLVVYERGDAEMTITVTGVIASEPDLVFTATIPGEGDVEITMRAIGGNAYEVALKESGSDRTETETFTYCPVGAEGPDGPMPGGGDDLTAFLFDNSAAAFGAFMTELEAACMPGSEQLCLDTFYGFADVTGDGLLTQAELARLTRFGAKWALSENMPRLREGHKLAIHLATMVTGPLVADGLIYNMDYDGNGALSRVELFPDGVENAPLAMEALMRTFTENTIEEVIDALEELDDLM